MKKCINIHKAAIVVILILSLIISLIPMTAAAASKSSKVKTYIFFGSDSRKKDDSWKSPAGGRITADSTGTQGTPRSDVIMLIKVDSKKKTIGVTSIYRDTLLDVSGKGKDFQKANKAYADLGPAKASKVIAKNLGIKIDGYVATNFKGVANVIDALGGVSVTVENEAVNKANRKPGRNNVPDVMNEYIDEMNRVYKTKTPHVTKAGQQNLSGLQAVAYARVRYTDGSDMKRSVRQRKVLRAMSAKYRSLDSEKKAAVLLTVLSNIDTNIGADQFSTLFKRNANYKMAKLKKMKGFPYYKGTYILKTKKEKGGLSEVLVPCDLKTNVVKLHKSFYGEKKYKAGKTVKKYSKKIVKKTKLTYKKRARSLDNKY